MWRKAITLWLAVSAWATSAWALPPGGVAEISPVPIRTDTGAVVPEQVEEHHLVFAKLAEGEFVAGLFSERLLPVDAVRAYGGVVFTGPPGLYAISIFDRNDTDQVLPRIYYVRIIPATPNPTPPDPVIPPGPVVPTGFAAEVYQQAIKVNDKSHAAGLATNYRNVASMIAAGKYKANELERIRTDITNANKQLSLPATWAPFGLWLQSAVNAKAQNINDARTCFEDIATGLEAAAK